MWRWYKKHPELIGIGCILFAMLHLVALCSFQSGNPDTNILGLFGHAIALFWYKMCGIAAISFMLTLIWIGTRLVIVSEYTPKKLIAQAVCHASFCLLLAQIAHLTPSFENFWKNLLGFKEGAFYLGGGPAY